MIPAACAIFFSSIFWIRNTVDFTGWSVVELTAVALFIRLLFKKEPLIIPSRNFSTPLLVLTLWATCSLLWTSNLHATLTGLYKVIFILLMTIVILNEPEQWRKNTLWSATTISFLAALVWFIMHVPNPPIPWINHPNLYGGFIALGGILCMGFFMDRHGFSQWLFFCMVLLIIFALIVIGSLGPILAWFAGTLFLFLVRSRNRTIAWKGFGALLFLLFLSVGIGRFLKNPLLEKVITRRLTDPFSLERIQIWKDSSNVFIHHFWTGTGLGTFRDHYPEFKSIEGLRNAPYAHNELLNIVCELGTVGAMLLAWLFCTFAAVVLRDKSLPRKHALWGAVAAGAMTQAFFDFNLHYPPILILAVFCAATIIPGRELTISQPKRRIAGTLFSILLGFLFLMPGLADILFRTSYADPERRRTAALLACRIDPFNAVYRMETGRLRDLFIATDLEPRNVWYRRSAARFFLKEWEDNRKPEALNIAMTQYAAILKLAPNVPQFRMEAEAIQKGFLKRR